MHSAILKDDRNTPPAYNRGAASSLDFGGRLIQRTISRSSVVTTMPVIKICIEVHRAIMCLAGFVPEWY